MSLKIFASPAVEPIGLQEAKSHLKLESGSYADNTTASQIIAPGAHVIAAAYSLKGTGIDVSAARNVLVLLESGTNLATGTVDVKLQESDTDVDANYTDVASGAFTQVTTANDNATYEKAYTGRKKYLRVVCTVANATCEFGVSVLLDSPTATDDTEITRLIVAARRHCENFSGRAYITQTWDLYLDAFPSGDEIKIPLPPLQTVTWIKYKNTVGTLTEWLPITDYIVDIHSEPGRIVLDYGISWPSTYGAIQAVQIRFVAGWGIASAVPEHIKQAILLKLTDLYQNRGDVAGSEFATINLIERAIEALLRPDRIIPV